jgi:hypothetical protein
MNQATVEFDVSKVRPPGAPWSICHCWSQGEIACWSDRAGAANHVAQDGQSAGRAEQRPVLIDGRDA